MNSPWLKTRSALEASRSRLARKFSPTRYLRRTDSLELLAAGGRSRTWVLSRALCAYTTFDATAIPARKRAGFVATAVSRWSPFSDTAWHVEWAGGRAMVWAWSPSAVLALQEDEAPPGRMLPESIFRGAPMADGIALVGMSEGCEGRVWKNGVLVASQWWPARPDPEAWWLFLRGAGAARGQPAAVPEPDGAPISERPWSRLGGNAAWGEVVARNRAVLVAAAAGLAAAVLMVPLGGALRLLVERAAVESEIVSQDESLQRIINARESAERDAARIDALVALRPPAGQVELMATVVGLMPGNDWKLLEWRMPDARTLEVDLQVASPDPRALVEAWEASGRFEGVTAELGRAGNEVGMRARVLRAPRGVAE